MLYVSVHQPWASLMAHGVKKVLSCNQPTRRRGLLGICACRHLHGNVRAALLDEDLQRAMAHIGHPRDPYSETGLPGDMPAGAVVGVARLADCIELEAAPSWMRKEVRRLGDPIPGRYLWVFEDARPLAVPVPAAANKALCRKHLGADEGDVRLQA